MELIDAPVWEMWATIFLIVVAMVVYALDRFPLEIVSVSVLCVLVVLFYYFPVIGPDGDNVLSPSALLAGFANPALFSIMGLLIIGQGMFQSGALERPTQQLLAAHEKHPKFTAMAVFVFVFVVSAVMNNTPVVVMFIPIMTALAAQRGAPASKIMMPLSYVCILGGMTTLIGSSTNLLVADVLRQNTGQSIGFFEFTPIGLVLALSGGIYLYLLGTRFLPHRAAPTAEVDVSGDGKQFITQIEVTADHPLAGEASIAGLFPDLPNLTVRMIQRRERAILPPYDDVTILPGDVLIIAATRNTLTKLLKSNPEIAAEMLSNAPHSEEAAPAPSRELTLIEAIVAPGSRMIGRSIEQIGFHYQTNCVLFGIQRRSRMIRARMNNIRLEAGDVLLVLGSRSDVRALRGNRDILLLEWSMTDLPDAENARIALAIFGITVGATAVGAAPIVISALVGAAMMVATGCLNIRQATRAIDTRIFFLVGASLAMGAALDFTGGANFIANGLVNSLQAAGPPIIMSAFFLITALATNVLSNNATAVLFTPIAISAANQLGVDPMVFVFTVIFGANCSFATPVGYQTNLLVMGPGHYTFRDFINAGAPLIVLLWIIYSVFAPFYYAHLGML